MNKHVFGEIKRFEEVKDYHLVASMNDAERLANFVNWVADKLPGIVIPYNIAFRAIFASARTPAPVSPESAIIRRTVSKANKVLRDTYSRSMITERGVGLRATIGSEEIIKVTYQRTGRRAKAAIRRLSEEHALIKISEVPKTPENLPLIDHYKRNTNLLSQVFEPKMLAAFAYEAPSEKKADKK